MVTFSDESLAIISGTTTAWLPVPSPWLSIAACSTQIYAQRGGLGGNLIAFDPLFGESIIPSAIPCLPTEVTSSWYQSNTAVTTVLGPTFVCPGAYSAVQTILVNPSTEQILCCPSKYSLNVAITGKGTFPSQCTSTLSAGQTLTYESTTPSGPWGIVTSTVPPTSTTSVGPTIVYGMHVNGFNVLQAVLTSVPPNIPTPSISTPGIPTPSTSTAGSTTTPATQTSSTVSPSSVNSPTSLSGSAVAVIAIGVALLVISLAAVAWFCFRRSVRRPDTEKQTYTPALMAQDFARSPLGLHEIGVVRGKEEPVEVDGKSKYKSRIYELGI